LFINFKKLVAEVEIPCVPGFWGQGGTVEVWVCGTEEFLEILAL
jgi:hypothetical protein